MDTSGCGHRPIARGYSRSRHFGLGEKISKTTSFIVCDGSLTMRHAAATVLGTVGTVVQLLKLRGFEGRKVAQCELETISFFGTARYSWYRVILGPSVSNHTAIVTSFCT